MPLQLTDHIVDYHRYFTGYKGEVLKDGPSLYLRLGETDGSVAYDWSGGKNHGTYSGSPTRAVSTPIGDGDGGVQFAGSTGDCITYPNLDIGHFTDDPFSIECLFKRVDTNPILSLGGAEHKVDFVGGANTIRFTQAAGVLTGSTAVVASAWYYLCITYDSGQVGAYLGRIGTDTAPHLDGAYNMTANWGGGGATGIIGGEYAGSGPPPVSLATTSAVDELAIYRYRLMPDRQAAHYAAIATNPQQGVLGARVTATPVSPAFIPTAETSLIGPITTTTDANGAYSLSLPWPSESPGSAWRIAVPGGAFSGTVPEGVTGPVQLHDLLTSYGWEYS